MQVVWRLCARPNGQLAIGILDGYRSVLLNGQVRVALEEKYILEDLIGLPKSILDIAEFQGYALVDISFFAVIVNARLAKSQTLFGVRNCGQDFVINIY